MHCWRDLPHSTSGAFTSLAVFAFICVCRLKSSRRISRISWPHSLRNRRYHAITAVTRNVPGQSPLRPGTSSPSASEEQSSWCRTSRIYVIGFVSRKHLLTTINQGHHPQRFPPESCHPFSVVTSKPFLNVSLCPIRGVLLSSPLPARGFVTACELKLQPSALQHLLVRRRWKTVTSNDLLRRAAHAQHHCLPKPEYVVDDTKNATGQWSMTPVWRGWRTPLSQATDEIARIVFVPNSPRHRLQQCHKEHNEMRCVPRCVPATVVHTTHSTCAWYCPEHRRHTSTFA